MNFVTTLRYLRFAVFIICNAILASVSVWNSSLVSSHSQQSRIDTYILVIGALGLALTFAIIFVELVRRNAFTSRVWFELLWTVVFFVLDLSAAVILSVLGLNDACTYQKNKKPPLPGTCASARVLMGFTWLCAFILLMYLTLLVTLTLVNWHNDSIPRIWECTVHNFPPLMSRGSNPPASHLPRFTQDKAPVTQAPPQPSAALYTLRSVGLNSQYQIEHFSPPAHIPNYPSIPVASPADYLHRNPSQVGNVQAAVALYPQFVSSAYIPPPPSTLSYPNQRPNRSPPPLGDWPRADAPLRIKRKTPPAMTPAPADLAPVRPIGPRTRARPPPLDLPSSRRHRDSDQHV